MNGTVLFSGVGVALLTFFSDDGALDASATADHAARLVDAGMRSVLVAGTTGEAAALEADERLTLLDAVRSAVPAATPVIAGTGAPSARQAAALTEAAVDHGADAVLALSPPQCGDPRPYYEMVAKVATGVPLLAYHFPTVSSPGITVEQLSELPVSGCKDSSGDPNRLLRTLDHFGGPLWVGSPSLTLLAQVAGAAGALLALGNLDPERCIAAWQGDVSAQHALAETDSSTSVRFPAKLKERVAQRFGTRPTARLG